MGDRFPRAFRVTARRLHAARSGIILSNDFSNDPPCEIIRARRLRTPVRMNLPA